MLQHAGIAESEQEGQDVIRQPTGLTCRPSTAARTCLVPHTPVDPVDCKFERLLLDCKFERLLLLGRTEAVGLTWRWDAPY